MTSDYVIVSIKLSPEVGNEEYIVLCNIASGHSMSGFEVIEEGGCSGPLPRPVAVCTLREIWILTINSTI